MLKLLALGKRVFPITSSCEFSADATFLAARTSRTCPYLGIALVFLRSAHDSLTLMGMRISVSFFVKVAAQSAL